MHPADTDLVATCRRDDALRTAAARRSHPLAVRRESTRARLGRRLVALGERLQAPVLTPAARAHSA